MWLRISTSLCTLFEYVPPSPGEAVDRCGFLRVPDGISHHRHCLISRLCAWRPAQHLTFAKARQAAHAEQTRGNKVWRGKVLVLASTHTQKVSTFWAFFFIFLF